MNLLSALLIAAASQQSPDSSAYLDRDARVLVARARAAQDSLNESIRSYTATVKQRMAMSLRTPLKDRTLYRHEYAVDVHWYRDQPIMVNVLGARQFHPGSDKYDHNFSGFGIDQLFDPTMDRLYFGLTEGDDDDVWIEHPLLEESEYKYRFQTGDTITISLPDGRTVRVVELRVLPRVNEPKLITGSIWIEPTSGAIVKAAYRSSAKFDVMRDINEIREEEEDLKVVPGIFKPFEIDITMISVEYSYWRLKHWLPRAMRMEGTARAGILVAPAAIEIAYDIRDVVDDDDTANVDSVMRAQLREARNADDLHVQTRRQNGRRMYVVVPDDEEKLRTSAALPPPIWESSNDFITEKELRKMYDGLADLPLPPVAAAISSFDWGFARSGLVRYNRVEGLSVGMRAQTISGAHTLSATGRIGIADLAPNAEVGAQRETLRRNLSASISHGLVAIDERSLGLGASFSALLLGRDDGDYYRSTGARISVTPPTTRPQWYRFTAFAERHRSVDRETNWSLPHLFDGGFDFRPNLSADSADLFGGVLNLRHWWGTDPRGFQFGMEMNNEIGRGDFEYVRSAITLRTAFSIADNVRTAWEIAAGDSEGTLPAQKQFFLGGSQTLRGYGGSSLVGPRFARARVELALARPEFGLALFSDAGWTGTWADFTGRQALISTGVGLTILDGLIRIDLARALRRPTGWRLELHLDSVL
jgi:hypothetical protein